MRILDRTPFIRKIFRSIGRRIFRLAENNEQTAFAKNGEGWLLHGLFSTHQRVAKERSFVVLDVGANRGDYSRMVLVAASSVGSSVDLHIFEPSGPCIADLHREFSGGPRVNINQVAASDHSGSAPLFADEGGSTQASLVPRPSLCYQAGETREVRLIRLDEYITARGLKRVDLLKLDIEGSELAALRGLGEKLDPAVVDLIQFEYGGATLDAGATLGELYRLCVGRGYHFAKLFPNFIEIRHYAPWMENFAYANYIALSPRSPVLGSVEIQ